MYSGYISITCTELRYVRCEMYIRGMLGVASGMLGVPRGIMLGTWHGGMSVILVDTLDLKWYVGCTVYTVQRILVCTCYVYATSPESWQGANSS